MVLEINPSAELPSVLTTTKFLSAKNDLKETWKLVFEVINNRRRKASLPSSFRSDDRVITDPFEIANTFCSYFMGIGPILASKKPSTNLSFQSFLAGNKNEPISLKLLMSLN